jgi:hypothetical protein
MLNVDERKVKSLVGAALMYGITIKEHNDAAMSLQMPPFNQILVDGDDLYLQFQNGQLFKAIFIEKGVGVE